ncbi:MAG TPA: ISNCY family transposase [Polyangiaceae bacterium]|nr:ISNCY family transposase [Polyangiaceae bacterium]
MRRKLAEQLGLGTVTTDHIRAREFETMSRILDELRKAVDLVYRDLLEAGGEPDTGREGMTAEQVLRALVVKQRLGLSYEELAFQLADSTSIRAFCRIPLSATPPKKSTLQSNIKRVTAKTVEKVNQLLIRYAQEQKIEMGRKVRSDCTVVETNIHEPSDSSLLWDCVRVLVRLMMQAKEEFGASFNSRRRRAKRRAMGILNAKSKEQRVALYRDLLKVTEETMRQANKVVEQLQNIEVSCVEQLSRVQAIECGIKDVFEHAKRVVEQTERRVLRGESVPATAKVVSIFEPHTDIIIKDRRDTLYGHKICLTSGASGLVLDLVVERGNPADSSLACKMVQRVAIVLGRIPKQVSFDGGFSSKANVRDIKEMGVEDVAFSKHVGLDVADMAKSKWVFRKLRNFRAGIEAGISFLKRTFRLSRCTWSGFDSFAAYAWASVLSCNLLVVARHLLV